MTPDEIAAVAGVLLLTGFVVAAIWLLRR